MKTIQKRWLPLFLLAVVTFLFPACNGSTNENAPDVPKEYPEGVITLHVRNAENGKTYIPVFYKDGAQAGYLYIGGDNNFYCYSYSYATVIKISDAGAKSITSVKTVPENGWANEVAVIPQHTYVVRVERDGDLAYNKVYVMEYILSSGENGGIIGADVQYCQWNPEE